MKFFTGKQVCRDARKDILVSLLLLLLCGWVLLIPFTRRASRMEFVIALVLMLAAAVVAVHIARRVRSVLRWYEDLLDNLPFPVVLTDRRMQFCYENKAAADTICHEFYAEKPLFNEIPEGYEIPEKVVCRMEHLGAEYKVTLLPLEGKAAAGYLGIFQNIRDLVEDCKSRADLIEEINRLLKRLNEISSNFANSTTALARCTQQQAASLHTVASIVNKAFSARTEEDLREMQAAITDISGFIKQGGAHVHEISQVAGGIVDASHSLSNTMKIMRNIVG